MATHTPHQPYTNARTVTGSSEQGSLLHRLTRCTAALADALHAHDQPLAHRWACELRSLGWSSGLPGPAASAGVLAMRLSDKDTSPGEIDLAFGETLAEAYRAILRLA
jgi:hypothetical protein